MRFSPASCLFLLLRSKYSPCFFIIGHVFSIWWRTQWLKIMLKFNGDDDDDSIEHSPSWEANHHSCSQEITRHWSLSWARCIQFTTFNPISVRFILILSSHLRLGLRSDFFPSDFPTKMLYASHLSHAYYMPSPSHSQPKQQQ
jgi:hypothetical protein